MCVCMGGNGGPPGIGDCSRQLGLVQSFQRAGEMGGGM